MSSTHNQIQTEIKALEDKEKVILQEIEAQLSKIDEARRSCQRGESLLVVKEANALIASKKKDLKAIWNKTYET
ncbi:hypothetical protein P691DRAFT_766425 [Macrolepiota fuliginosa MF-IS2]|uniref:Uncharacterized protein n=1 Tax=Macrolepiota fuliginosa MF-IS2 TaxID=1400762 RepID=A0A9P6BXD1_9AGAR|nr:hypothetical protein P691DRAFT_766425 [Macrolepiota fuliginosa MF-IS2]